MTNELQKIPLLSGVDHTLLEELVARREISSQRYPKGVTIHNQQDTCGALDVVLSGILVAYALSENGSAVTMFEFRENALIGANLLFGDGAYPLNIFSVTACELLHINRNAVLELLHISDFVMCYVKALSMNSLGMNRKIAMLAQKTLRENLLGYLRQQALMQDTTSIRLPISKKELADHMGVQRPSLFRELKKMKDEGIIQVKGRTINMR